MDYRFIRNARARGRFADWWPPALLLGALVLFHFSYPTVLGDIASRVASPFWKAERLAEETLVHLSLFFTSKQTLVRDLESLDAELTQARSLLADRELLLEENRLLRGQFGSGEDKKSRPKGAVLAAPPRSPYDTAVIDIGSRDGIEVGDAALSGSVVLGVVSKTFSRTSLVEFFSTAGKETPVLILHDGAAVQADARGEGGGAFRARLPREVPLRVGDVVVMPPWNVLKFATVSAIEGNAADSFQTVRFKNPIPIQSLRFLEIQRSVVEKTP